MTMIMMMMMLNLRIAMKAQRTEKAHLEEVDTQVYVRCAYGTAGTLKLGSINGDT